MKKPIGRLVSILHRQSQIYINCALKEFNVTSAECSFLMALYRKDGVSQEELSSYLYIDKSATNRAIKSLVEKGYVLKTRDKVDKRFTHICLTEKAKEIKKEIIAKVHSWSDFLMEGLDEGASTRVYDILEGMVDKVEHTDLKKKLEVM
ncbi:MAG: MarR family transcriptional regulator [Eubacteriaceae bacterium]|nr:MarR family transcriptional regulator [Eubacteriaceae bacterium]